jgi:anti-anti-sigma factor
MPPKSDQVLAVRDGRAPIRRPAFSVRLERVNEIDRLNVSGELDLATRGTLIDALRRAEASNAKRILLDLSELTFIDSTGIKVLLDAHQRSATNSRRLRLSPVDGQVREVLQLTGVIDILDFTD